MAECIAFWPTEKVAAKMQNVSGEKFVAMLSAYLKENGDQVLLGAVRLTLTDRWLEYLNGRFPQCEADDFTPGLFVPAVADQENVAFLFEFMQMLESVKIIHDKKARAVTASIVDITRFRGLKGIEFADIPVGNIVGLSSLCNRIESIVFCGSLSSLKELFGKCGADGVASERLPITTTADTPDGPPVASGGVLWSSLTRAFCSGCGLASTDDAFRFVPYLKSLDVSHNKLATISPDFRLLMHMERLDLSFNSLSSVVGINAMLGKVTWLSLKGNTLTSVMGLDRLYSLEHLDVSDNCLDSFTDAAKLGRLPLLSTLRLSGNPVAFHNKYRVLVLTQFSERLDEFVLDGAIATPIERKAVAMAAPLEQAVSPAMSPVPTQPAHRAATAARGAPVDSTTSSSNNNKSNSSSNNNNNISGITATNNSNSISTSTPQGLSQSQPSAQTPVTSSASAPRRLSAQATSLPAAVPGTPSTPVMEAMDISTASLMSVATHPSILMPNSSSRVGGGSGGVNTSAHVTPVGALRSKDGGVDGTTEDASFTSAAGSGAVETPRVTALRSGKSGSAKKPGKRRKAKEAIIHDESTFTVGNDDRSPQPVMIARQQPQPHDQRHQEAKGDQQSSLQLQQQQEQQLQQPPTDTPTIDVTLSPNVEPIQFASADPSSDEDILRAPLQRQSGQLLLSPVRDEKKGRCDSTAEFQQRVLAMREEGGNSWLMILNGLEESRAQLHHTGGMTSPPSGQPAQQSGMSPQSTPKKKGHARQQSLATTSSLSGSGTNKPFDRRRSGSLLGADKLAASFDPFTATASENGSLYATPTARSPGSSTDNLDRDDSSQPNLRRSAPPSAWGTVARAVVGGGERRKKNALRPKSMPASAFEGMLLGDADANTTTSPFDAPHGFSTPNASVHGMGGSGAASPSSTRSPAGQRRGMHAQEPRSRAGACTTGLVETLSSSPVALSTNESVGSAVNALPRQRSSFGDNGSASSVGSDGLHATAASPSSLPPVREPTHEFFADALVAGGNRATRILTVGNNAVVESDVATGRVIHSYDTRVLVEINDVFLAS
eukprot:Opistho-2@15536